MSDIHQNREALLSAYLDRELDPRQRALVEEHLAGCAGCREELAALREGAALLGTLASPPPLPADDRLRGRTRREGARVALTALLVILPIAATRGLLRDLAVVGRADLPPWFRWMRAAGYGLILPPLTILEFSLLRHVRDLVEYGWLSGRRDGEEERT